MLRLLIFYLLALLTVSHQVVLARSNLQTTLVTEGYAVGLSYFHNIYHPNIVGHGAFWIWNNEGYASPLGRTLTFETLFYTDCPAPIELNITADHNFKAFLDGQLVAEGKDWKLVSSIKLETSCGSHNMTIVVEQGFGNYGPGLIFIVSQDQSDCFSCGLNGFWDYSACRCSCLTIFGCARPQIWMGYPACTCRCPGMSLNSGSKL